MQISAAAFGQSHHDVPPVGAIFTAAAEALEALKGSPDVAIAEFHPGRTFAAAGAAAAMGVFGGWIGLRHLARASATRRNRRLGWLLIVAAGTGMALRAAILMSILALDASFRGGFELALPGRDLL